MSDSLALRRKVWISNDFLAKEKAALDRVLARVKGVTGGGLTKARDHVVATGQIVREGAESGLTGVIIGGARGKFGPNISIPGWNGADGQPVLSAPMEAVAMLVGYGGAMAFPQEEVAPTLKRVGNAALAILAARKTEAWISGMGTPGDATAHGDFGVDGISKLAASLSKKG
jgi:hypothetical protein